MVDIKYDVLKEEPITLAKAREILETIEEKNYDQKLALEHAKKFSAQKPEEAEALLNALTALDMRKLKKEQMVKLVDVMPEDAKEVELILSNSDVPFKEEEVLRILEVIKSKK